jgi:hypothetical protein
MIARAAIFTVGGRVSTEIGILVYEVLLVWSGGWSGITDIADEKLVIVLEGPYPSRVSRPLKN